MNPGDFDALPGRHLLISLKRTAGASIPGVGIAVGPPAVGTLRPVATEPALLRSSDIQTLTEGRNRFVDAFLTQFEATADRTAKWLTDVVGPNDAKILFMFDNLSGETFGYLGLDFIDWRARSGEADAVVRTGDAPHGAMTSGLSTLLGWARGQLGLESLGVRVRSDNPAISFYRGLGYEEAYRIPLVRKEGPGLIRWVEDPHSRSAALELVHMRWTRL